MGILDFLTTKRPVQTLGLSGGFEVKKAFDAARYGIAGVPAYPQVDRFSLMDWQRKNELVFACIRKKVEAASDPELVVERFVKGDWETVEGHPLVALLDQPNPVDTWDDFLAAWIGSEDTTGDFYAEIVRGQGGVPVQLWPLDPSCMFPIPDTKGGIDHYEFRSGYSPIIRLEVTDVLHRRLPDLHSRYYGMSPLRAAIGSIDGDQAQTDFTRAFFHGDGIPAGLLKIKNATLSKEQANSYQQQWHKKFSRGGTQYKQVGVLDQNADFQQIGTNLKETESDSTRSQYETRICMVFGVPPALIGAFAGLKFATTNATMKSHLQDFWNNTMSPDMKKRRKWLTAKLLPEFEPMDAIRKRLIRVNWDMTQVMAMQEDDNARHSRARDNFAAGMWTINEARDATGQEPLPEDYFVQPVNVEAIAEAVRATIALTEPQKQPAQLQDPNKDAIDGQIVNEPPPKQLGDGKSQLLAMPSVVRSEPAPIPSKSTKSVEWNGLTLGRMPTPLEEKLDLKGMVASYDAEAGRLSTILLQMRSDLIAQVADAAKQHDASDIYQLLLTPPSGAAKKLTKEITNAVSIGRDQVVKELAAQRKSGIVPETKDRDTKISELIQKFVDTIISRSINEIQARAASIFASLRLLGLSKDEVISRIESELGDQSTKVFESFASQTANAAINAGREDEMNARADEIASYEYSAILDKNTCDTCDAADGQESDSMADLPEAPNPDCDGGPNCRCFIIAIGKEENA